MPQMEFGKSPIKPSFAPLVEDSKVVPVISNEVLCNLVLGGYEGLVRGYAGHIGYPFDYLSPNHRDFLKMTNYRRIHNPEYEDESWERSQLGDDYLKYIKDLVLTKAKEDGVDPQTLKIAGYEKRRLTASDFADRLGYPVFAQGRTVPVGEETDPLLILANLPISIYITTSYHAFIEAALRKVGKRPRSDFCRWHSRLVGIPSVFEDDDYGPKPDEPLVYHLHGMDSHPRSLVLTEDDYLRFLVSVSQGSFADSDRIPDRIRQVIIDSALVFLGFELDSWAFRVFLWGLIKQSETTNRGHITFQVEPNEDEKDLVRRYLKEQAKLEIYWGDIHQYTQDLRDIMRSQR